MVSYVKYETPKELVGNILEALASAKNSGKIKKGANETTKAIEKSMTKFVVIAEDVSPLEVVVHLPDLAASKNVTCCYVPTKKELGAAVGIAVGTTSVAIIQEGNASEMIRDIVEKVKGLNK